MANISFISTVFNEEDSIKAFLDSLLAQKRLPDEVVIVDAGSIDGTWDLLKSAAVEFKKAGVAYELYRAQGNRSYGRNYAISRTQHDWIAVSDAGCILDPKWLLELEKHSKNMDVVSGYYSCDIDSPSIFQKALASYMCVMPDALDPKTFLPSSRSVMFTKSAWQSVKRYPENLDLCEDLVFARRLKDAGYAMALAKDAIVYWPQKKTLWDAVKQFYGYAYGDGQARYVRTQTPLLFGRYIVGGALLWWVVTEQKSALWVILPLILYSSWAVSKNYRYVTHWKAFIYLPVLQFVSDFSVMLGMGYGFMRGQRKGRSL